MRRGWCPTVYEPMPSGDGLLVRVKPPGSRLTPAQARALAQAAARDSNGAIELTGRANLQVRGLSPASVPRFAQAMVDAGLACPDRDAERRRTVAVTPFAAAGMRHVAGELETLLSTDAALAPLPGKFGFAVGLPSIRADVHLHPADGAWRVWPDGAAAAAMSDAPAADALRLAHAFLHVAPDAPRMRAANPAAMFAAAGLTPATPLPEQSAPPIIGLLPGGFGIGLPFGVMDAAVLAELAEWGALHLSPWRAVVACDPSPRPPPARGGGVRPAPPPLAGGGRGEGATVADLAASLGLIVDPADPRRTLAACPGRPACAAAHADVRADALRLAQLHPRRALHVSGCAKGCAHPGPSAITLVAGADGYALVRDGTASGSPLAGGLTFDEAAAMIAS